ncbi:hypothetical protein [Aphanizomenon flos-aquae]|nr:hypothetical protein [Aphanizomenon flos-aquae]
MYQSLETIENMTIAIQSTADIAQQAVTIINDANHTATKTGAEMDLTLQNIFCVQETVDEIAKKSETFRRIFSTNFPCGFYNQSNFHAN